jgi:hypothetical protein
MIRSSVRARRLGRLPATVLATVLAIGGGTGLAVLATSGTPAGADTTLGGFTVTALAEGITAQYEQPNFPLPATPSLEVDEGYASTSDNFGPTGSATASTLYPGQFIASAGTELGLLAPGLPLPAGPEWPVEAVSGYPQTPNTTSVDEPGLNMDAVSNTNESTATATIGDDAPTAGADAGALGSILGTLAPSTSGNPLASTSSIFGVGLISGSSTSETSDTAATATASATDSGISILAGFITIGGVTSTATATSDGTTGTVSGSTLLNNVDIAGDQVTVTASGIQALGKNAPLSLPISTINTLLKELGITISVTNPTDVVASPSASRTLDGLKISINLDTLDTAAYKFTSLLPASLTSKLPIAIPNQQLLTIDLGTVSVNSTASPAFDDSSGDSGSTSTGDDTSGGFTPSTDGSLGAGDDFGADGDIGSALGAVGGTSSTTPGTGSGTANPASAPASAVTPVTAGMGAGFILLLVLAALALAYAYKRVDDASELVGSGCAEGDPLNDLFKDVDV